MGDLRVPDPTVVMPSNQLKHHQAALHHTERPFRGGQTLQINLTVLSLLLKGQEEVYCIIAATTMCLFNTFI